MGYQSGTGLRIGRTKDKLTSDKNTSNTLGTAGGSSTGYRAAGAVSSSGGQSVGASSPTGGVTSESPLSQFNADMPTYSQPQAPKAPSLLQTVGGAVASNALMKGAEKGAGMLWDKFAGDGSSIPKGYTDFLGAESSDPINSMGDSQGWWEGSTGDTAGAANAAGNFAGSAAQYPGYMDFLSSESGDAIGSLGDASGWWDGASGASGTTGVSGAASGTSTFGTYAPYAGAAIKAAQGDVEGGAKTAAGVYAGQAIGSYFGPIGAAVGGWVGGAIGGGCFITEATMAGLGVQDDNAEPLKVLRFFRDKVLSGTPQGQGMIEEYNAIAPLVVEAVESRPDAMDIFKALYEQFIVPSVEAVKTGNYPEALQIYASMINAVTPFAQQAMQEQDEMMGDEYGYGESISYEQAEPAMEQMASHAGQVAQNPQIAQQATGALNQFSADNYPTPVRFGRR